MGFNDDWYPEPYRAADPDQQEDNSDWAEDQQEIELAFDILVHTTEKAYLLQFGEENVWFPKGQAVINMSMHKNTVLVPKWLMKEKGLEKYSTGRSIDASKAEKLFDKVVREHIKGLKEDNPF